jgi:hypothetical protein
MTTERVHHKTTGWWMDADEAAQLDASIADESVFFVGMGRNRDLVHVIAGASKGARQPFAKCGLWVSNRFVPIIESDRVCSKCTKGGATFTRLNQPRQCGDCGRTFADSTKRDNNQTLCPDCYDRAGYENAHVDGYHKADAEGPQEDCPMCRSEQREAAGEEEKTPEEAHENGEHEECLQSDCSLCSASLEYATVSDPIGDDPMVRIARLQVEHAERRVNEKVADLAARFRRLADEIEREGTKLTDASAEDVMGYTAADRAASIVNQISWAIPNAGAHDLILET